MKRREFITLFGGAAAAWPLVANAQTPKMPVIGFLMGVSPDGYAPMVDAFREGLKETGFIEGQNVTIEYRWAEGQSDRLPELAADLVRQQVTVIVAGSINSALAAKAATTTIPIVFNVGSDPVSIGLVPSLNGPVGNITGVTKLGLELGPKRLELLHELVPTVTIMAACIDPTNPDAEIESQNFHSAASTLDLQLKLVNASAVRDFDPVFATLDQLHAGALVIGAASFFNSQSEKLAGLSVRHKLPTIYQYREFTAAGGLMSYGSNQEDSDRIAGVYTGRILNGEKPADLPVQQSMKVELIINLKTAKALGITVPLPLLGRADEVIE